MKKHNLLFMAIAAMAAIACNKPTDPWEKIDAIIPGNFTYTVSISEMVNSDAATGIASLDAAHKLYAIAFADEDGYLLGHLDFVGNSGKDLNGNYVVAESSTLTIDGTKVTGDFSLEQNALNSLTVKADGKELITLAKGVGVPDYTRPSNNDCVNQFLLNKNLGGEGVYTVNLALGAKGVTAEEGIIDQYKGNGDYVILRLNAAQEGLQAGTYKPCAFGAPAPETFTVGKDQVTDFFGTEIHYLDGSQFYTLKDDEAVVSEKIIGGEITLAVADAEKETWTLAGYLILSDGRLFDIAYSGRLAKENNVTPPAAGSYTYTDEVSQVSEWDFSTWTQTVIPGIEQHVVVISDENNAEAARFTFVTTEGASNYAGTYEVVESVKEAGKMNNGYDLSALGLGIGGSYWINSDGGYEMFQPGDVVEVKDEDGRVLTFTSGDFTITAKPVGGTPGEDPTPKDVLTLKDEVSDVYNQMFQVVEGVKTHSVSLTKGEEAVAVFAFILPEGTTDYTGTYECIENATEAYKLINGFDLSMFGMGIGGSYWYNDGNVVLINAGTTLTIAKDAEDVYSFSFDDKVYYGK